ncbi:sugar ABC transporter substrate-binding protein [Marinicrinis sediminis]|uniref:Sugar ABC transporter substrate-binding protein n=1 Tax=Marinicrinis sediminis TaxID=1652465 RepID=A0ABW5R8M5_9BACL
MNTKIVNALIVISGLVLCLCVGWVVKVLYEQPNIQSHEVEPAHDPYRIAYISDELGTDFWKRIQHGVQEEVDPAIAEVAFWGGYRKNAAEFLKQMDMAIAAKVDGMIVYGKETEAFDEIINKALMHGIPVMTIAADSDSKLRKTYIGSNHYAAGKEMGAYMLRTVNPRTKVAVIRTELDETAEQQHLIGLKIAFSEYPELRVIDSSEQQAKNSSIEEAVKQVLNEHPDCRVFIAMEDNTAQEIAKELQRRFDLRSFSIYAFEDSQETLRLMEHGVVKATIRHEPEQMGKTSLAAMLQWIKGERLPLKKSMYTPFELMTGEDL